MIIPALFGQANLRFTGDNLPTGAEVTFGFFNETDAEAANCCLRVSEALGTSAVMGEFGDDETITNVHVKLGPNVSGPFADLAVDFVGGVSTSITPPNLSVLIKKSSSIGGRKGAGRMFWPGAAEGSVGSDGTLEGAYVLALQDVFSTFLADLSSNEVPMRLLHNDATIPSAVLALVPDAVAATQRRRLRR